MNLATLLAALAAPLLGPATPALALGHGSSPHDDAHAPASASASAPASDRGLQAEGLILRDIAFLQRRLDSQPDDRALLAKRASLELDLARRRGEHEDYRLAESSFREALALRASPDAEVGLAYALTGQHRFEEALEHARLAAQEEADAASVRALLGDLHFALGHYAEAQLAYECLSNERLCLQSLARMAQIHQQAGRLDEAARLYADAFTAGELLHEAPGRLAWCSTMIGDLARERGQLDQAACAWQRAFELDPGAHAVLLRMAELDQLRGALPAACARLEKLVREHPRPSYWIALAELLLEMGQAGRAEHLFELAESDMQLDLERGDLGHLRELAELCLRAGREPARAVALARMDLEQVRQDSGAFETLGWALHLAGQEAEALESMRKGLRAGPGHTRLLCRAAILFDANGQRSQAISLAQLAASWNSQLQGQFSTRLDGEFLPPASRLAALAWRGR